MSTFITITLEKMTDAQQLIDYAKNQFNEIAADVERHFDLVAGNLRERFAKTPLAPAPRRLPPPTTWQIAQRWMIRNKALTAALVAFFVTGSVGALVYVKSNGMRRKRRARKSQSGARTDVVVVAGAVANPLMCALYLDLERRGFVVYVVTPTAEDEHYIRSQSRADLHPLPLDLVDPFLAQNQIGHFQNLFGRKHYAFDHAEPHYMNFRGLILVPDIQSSPARVEDISAEEWSDALNAKVLNTIATTHILLPSIIENKAKVLLLAPSITPSLRLPKHSLESTVYGALRGFTKSLAAELAQDNVKLTEFKLGNIDIPAVTIRQRREGIKASWLKPTPVRQLHDAVFDKLVAKHPSRTVHIGRGALTYDLIGSITPAGLLTWLLGPKSPSKAFQGGGQRLGGLGLSDDEMQGSAGSLTWEKIDEEA